MRWGGMVVRLAVRDLWMQHRQDRAAKAGCRATRPPGNSLGAPIK